MYKKLLSLKRSSDRWRTVRAAEEEEEQEEEDATTTVGQQRRGGRAEEPANCCAAACNICCTACCSTCCSAATTRPGNCQLCSASFVLPSCVGAIRALQYNMLQQTAAATAATHNTQPAGRGRHSCCQANSKWLPASESLTRHKLQLVAKTRCCC